ncbi:MAG: glycosyltransferase family 39 protein [Acidobacteria bacterium]|nr:glycosyltransferase family 39 protein [Acidobacteriota bacterium]
MNERPDSLRPWTHGRGAVLLLVLAVTVGFGLRWWVQTPTARYSSDSFHYLLLAQHLAAGEGFVSGGSQHPDLSRPPLFPMAIAAFIPVSGDAGAAARLVITLAGSLAVVPLFFLARAMLGSGAALAMLPLASLSCLIGGAMRFLPTSLSTLLALMALAMTYAAGRQGWAAPALLAGLLAGLAALTRSEGVVWPLLLALWILVAPAAGRYPWSRRPLAMAALLGGSLLVYMPYVTWAWGHLGRFDPAPPITYLTQMRDMTDRLGLRWVEGGTVPWEQRAAGLLSADHTQLILSERFSHSHRLEPDPAGVDLEFTDLKPGQAPALTSLLRRRLAITAVNTRRLLTAVHYGHFAPAILVLLSLAGLPLLIRPGHRGGTLFLLLVLAGSLVPVVSHVERRFLYLAFGLTLLPAAAGWQSLARLVARAAGRRARLAQAVVSAVLLLLVLGAGLANARVQQRPVEQYRALEKAAAALAKGPPGAVLAVQPAVAYLAGRPFRLLPVAKPAAVLDYARAQGATQIILEGSRDLTVRPALEGLSNGSPPPGYTLTHAMDDPRGGQALIFALDTAR